MPCSACPVRACCWMIRSPVCTRHTSMQGDKAVVVFLSRAWTGKEVQAREKAHFLLAFLPLTSSPSIPVLSSRSLFTLHPSLLGIPIAEMLSTVMLSTRPAPSCIAVLRNSVRQSSVIAAPRTTLAKGPWTLQGHHHQRFLSTCTQPTRSTLSSKGWIAAGTATTCMVAPMVWARHFASKRNTAYCAADAKPTPVEPTANPADKKSSSPSMPGMPNGKDPMVNTKELSFAPTMSRKQLVTLADIPTLSDCYDAYPEPTKLHSAPNALWSKKISLWHGDITTLQIDAIVNAANESLLGGGGIDGAIHNAAGRELLAECRTLRGCDTGDAKITKAYKLPCKHVIHTVGPQGEKPGLLRSCYKRVLEVARKNDVNSVAFCCISTGIYGYDNKKAAHVALQTVRDWMDTNSTEVEKMTRIIFCTFLEKDKDIYQALLPAYFPKADNVDIVSAEDS
ncbi:unnamed protein product [Mortierella alpina]